MTSPETDELENAIRDMGEDWLIDGYSPSTDALSHIRQRLAEASQKAQARYGDDAQNLSEQALLEEYRANPERVRGILQVLGSSCTPETLVLVWRLAQGYGIQTVEIHYHQHSLFQMSVLLEGETEPYTSKDMNDFKIFRHVGVMKVGNGAVFDGFYPLRLG